MYSPGLSIDEVVVSLPMASDREPSATGPSERSGPSAAAAAAAASSRAGGAGSSMDAPGGGGAGSSTSDSVIKIMVASDVHLGYGERDPIRKDDSLHHTTALNFQP